MAARTLELLLLADDGAPSAADAQREARRSLRGAQVSEGDEAARDALRRLHAEQYRAWKAAMLDGVPPV